MAALKDNDQRNDPQPASDTTQKNTEQDWLKTNLAKFSRMLQGQKDLVTVGQLILSELAPVVGAQHGEFYVLDHSAEQPRLKLLASYASSGQRRMARCSISAWVSSDNALSTSRRSCWPTCRTTTLRISSGLGEAMPRKVLVLPVIFEGQVKGVHRARQP